MHLKFHFPSYTIRVRPNAHHIPYIRHANESINDANDRAIVVAAEYLEGVLGASPGNGCVVFITNDFANKVGSMMQDGTCR